MAQRKIDSSIATTPNAAAATLKPIVFATEGAAKRGQFGAWHDRCSTVVGLSTDRDPSEGFAARNALWPLGNMALSHVVTPASRLARTPVMTRRDGLDHWMIGVLRQGTMQQTAGHRSLIARPGEVFHFSLGEELAGERTDCDWSVLIVPRDILRDVAPALDARRNTVTATPMGALFRDFMGLLEARLPSITDQEVPALAEATCAMIKACLGAAGPAPGDTQLDGLRMERVRRIVQANLHAPGFNPKRLCRLAGMSRSHLYRLFEPSGGVARYIQGQRLMAAHAALADPEQRAPIAAIAEAFGFCDASTFSRAFRAEYGYRPSDVRLAGWGGGAIPARPRPAAQDPADFASLLRQLQR